MYTELLLLASAALAIVATRMQSSKVSRFGLGFYVLFSSLAIYGMGEVVSALLYLLTLGVAITALIAFLDARLKASEFTSSKIGTTLTIVIGVAFFTVSYLLFQNPFYAIATLIASTGVLAIEKRSLLRTMTGLLILGGAIFVILTRIGYFTPVISVPLCLFALASGVGFLYAFRYNKE